MRNAIIGTIIVIFIGGWFATKFIKEASKSEETKEELISYAKNYDRNTQLFLTEQIRLDHKAAFKANYQKWKFSPISELDLGSHFDRKKYYLTIGKAIADKAKSEGQTPAYDAIVAIGEKYGVDRSKPKDKAGQGGNSKLGSPKLGDKKKLPPNRHFRD